MCYSLPVQRIGIRELRQNASRYLAAVQRGESVEVTDRGELVGHHQPGCRERQVPRPSYPHWSTRARVAALQHPPTHRLERDHDVDHDALESNSRRAILIYLDSSALLRLIFLEDESASLQQWLEARPHESKVTSILSRVEVLRVCARESRPPPRSQKFSLRESTPLRSPTSSSNWRATYTRRRSFDAIHLVSALSIQEELSAVVAYDRRLLEACAQYQLNTVSPGR